MLNLAALLSIAWAGLHAPGGFVALWIVFSCSILMILLDGSFSRVWFQLVSSVRWLWSAVALILYSSIYASMMIFHGFWALPSSAKDLLNAIGLPVLMFVAGSVLCLSRPRLTKVMMVAFSIAALAFPVFAIIFAQVPGQPFVYSFTRSILHPWNRSLLNIRSVENSAFFGLVLLPWAFYSLWSRMVTKSRKVISLAVAIPSTVLSLFVVRALTGRLWVIAFILASASVVFRVVSDIRGRQFAAKILSVLIILLLFSGLIFYFEGSQSGVLPIRQLCDERFSLYYEYLLQAWMHPWGGKEFSVIAEKCGGGILSLVPAGPGINAVHNVFLDIHYAVGLIPLILFLASVFSPIARFVKVALDSRCYWNDLFALQVCWFCALVPQYLFQPLQYADGIVFYISFFWLGSVAVVKDSSANPAPSL